MKINYYSDIHLEFFENSEYFMQQQMPAGDILILAGDIAFWGKNAHPFFDKISKSFRHVFMVPGNHEFYGGIDIEVLEKPFKLNIRENVYLVNNITENINGVDFFFTPLWGKISPDKYKVIGDNVADFHKIVYKGKRFTAADFNNLFSQSFAFLNLALNSSVANKKVVVTHHCPTKMATASEFKNDNINEAFVVELHDFIYNNYIDYWIFGHTHRNEPSVNINGTTVLTNQLGYVRANEHKKFRMDAGFEL